MQQQASVERERIDKGKEKREKKKKEKKKKKKAYVRFVCMYVYMYIYMYIFLPSLYLCICFPSALIFTPTHLTCLYQTTFTYVRTLLTYLTPRKEETEEGREEGL